MISVWTNKVASKNVTSKLGQFAVDCNGIKLDWGGETSYGFFTDQARRQFFVLADQAGFDLETGITKKS